jgi:hypothetical protein
MDERLQVVARRLAGEGMAEFKLPTVEVQLGYANRKNRSLRKSLN